jgi:SulP family sulfate permease
MDPVAPSSRTHALFSLATAALVTASFTIIAAGSFASLIFAGSLQGSVGYGTWSALFTALVVGAVVATTSSYRGAIAIPQDRIAPILGLMAGNIVARMPDAPADQVALTVLAAIALVSVVTGLFLYALGALRLGNLVRYVPYPVIGGFLAGSGWLLVRGGLQVMAGEPLADIAPSALADPRSLSLLVPGVLFGLLLFAAVRLSWRYLLVSLTLIAGVVLFYVALDLLGQTPDAARAAGWLPERPASTTAGGFAFEDVVSLAPWWIILGEGQILLTILLTSVVSILLTASALELASEQEIDLNRELRSSGLATAVAGIGGGMVGFHSLSLSRLVLSMGAASRWVGITAALLCGLALWVGTELALGVPKFVAGGLLLFMGLMFLWEWVYEARRKMTPVDYAVVLLILGVTGAIGYPEGVAVGIAAAVTLFIHNYSRVSVVTHALSGAHLRSNVERPPHDLQRLREHGEGIYVLRLQGFIFFGTANDLLHDVRERIQRADRSPLRFLILDLRRVSGLDSSAIFSLSRVEQLAEKHGFTLVLTDVKPEAAARLGLPPLDSGTPQGPVRTFPDLDHGLEWCESEVLGEHAGRGAPPPGLVDQLRESWPAGEDPAGLITYVERLEIPAGHVLIEQQAPSDALYFLERGQLTARLELAAGQALRLRTLRAGTVVGEVGLFLGVARTASVVADRPSVVYRLSSASLERLQQEDPRLALAFHRFIVVLLAERLDGNSRLLRGLLE